MSNPANLLIATGIVKLHVSLPGSNPGLAASYTTLDLGERQITIKSGGDIKEMWQASGGTLGKQKKRRVKPTLSYEMDINHFSADVLKLFFGTATAGAPAPGKIVEYYGYVALQMEDEPTVASGGNAGESIIKHHSFACAVSVDGDLDAKGEEFAGVKLMIDVLLGKAKGVMEYGTRPITATA